MTLGNLTVILQGDSNPVSPTAAGEKKFRGPVIMMEEEEELQCQAPNAQSVAVPSP